MKSNRTAKKKTPAPAKKSADQLVNLRDKLSTVIFQAEARRKLKPSPGLDTVIETLRYVWDAVEGAIQS